jgi:hypothetical protein
LKVDVYPAGRIRAMLRILGPEIDGGMIETEANRRQVAREWTIAAADTES